MFPVHGYFGSNFVVCPICNVVRIRNQDVTALLLVTDRRMLKAGAIDVIKKDANAMADRVKISSDRRTPNERGKGRHENETSWSWVRMANGCPVFSPADYKESGKHPKLPTRIRSGSPAPNKLGEFLASQNTYDGTIA